MCRLYEKIDILICVSGMFQMMKYIVKREEYVWMAFLDELESLGVDTREGLERVMGDESLYEMMFGIFLSTIESAQITLSEFDSGDLEGLIGKVHSLKGTTGNLSITPLFTKYTEALNLLRENRAAEARMVYADMIPTQTAIIDCIRRYQG